jgi:hypothetical protein
VPTAAVGLVPCGALKTAVTDIMRRKGDAIMPRTKAPSAPQRITTCTSLDDLALTLLERIRLKLDLTKMGTAKMIVRHALEKKIKLPGITKFYQEVWTNLAFEDVQRFSTMRLDWTPEENALLRIYARHLLRSNNRSEALRVLIAYYAVQNKLAVVGQLKKATIIPM